MYEINTFTECGGDHETNEDAFQVKRHPQDESCLVCVLADGQGGRSGGREAAETACRVTVQTALSCPPNHLERPASWPGILHVADMVVQKKG